MKSLTAPSIQNSFLFLGSSMLFFWCIYEGIISFIAPIFIIQNGFSAIQMGFIMSLLSISGAFFDFILSKFIKNINYIHLFFATLFICSIFPFIFWSSRHFFLLVITMIIWGFYYDLVTFGTYNFVSIISTSRQHSSYTGIVSTFRNLGFAVAPFIAGLMVKDVVTFTPFLYSFFFVCLSFIIFVFLFIFGTNQKHHLITGKQPQVSLVNEVVLWRKVGHILSPVLIFTFLINFFDAAIWVIGPLTFNIFPQFGDFAGIFMTLYSLPVLITGWFIGKFTQQFGKKKTAFFSLILSSPFLIALFFLKSPLLVLVSFLIFSFFFSISWPAIKSAFVDYIAESRRYEPEIQGLNDFYGNIGYFVGPLFAGILVDKIGPLSTLAVIGVFNLLITIILLFLTPRHINVVIKSSHANK